MPRGTRCVSLEGNSEGMKGPETRQRLVSMTGEALSCCDVYDVECCQCALDLARCQLSLITVASSGLGRLALTKKSFIVNSRYFFIMFWAGRKMRSPKSKLPAWCGTES